MKRGTEIFKFQKEGWERSIQQHTYGKSVPPHPVKGYAKGTFILELQLTIVENHHPAPSRNSQGWQIWQDCLYQCGEFRGALSNLSSRKAGPFTMVEVEIEYPLL